MLKKYYEDITQSTLWVVDNPNYDELKKKFIFTKYELTPEMLEKNIYLALEVSTKSGKERGVLAILSIMSMATIPKAAILADHARNLYQPYYKDFMISWVMECILRHFKILQSIYGLQKRCE